MKSLALLIIFMFFSMPAYASGLETETRALIVKHAQTASYHARLSLRFAEFALHEHHEGDWVDACYFLKLARQHDRQATEGGAS